MRDIRDFASLKIKLASPQTIHDWSYGEVKKPETITTELFVQSAMVFSMRKSSELQKSGNVIVENLNQSATKV